MCTSVCVCVCVSMSKCLYVSAMLMSVTLLPLNEKNHEQNYNVCYVLHPLTSAAGSQVKTNMRALRERR